MKWFFGTAPGPRMRLQRSEQPEKGNMEALHSAFVFMDQRDAEDLSNGVRHIIGLSQFYFINESVHSEPRNLYWDLQLLFGFWR